MDPVQTLNTAIKRPLYPMPTLEENLHHLTGARQFALADALVGFTPVSPRWLIQSFWQQCTHTIGRVKWLRLPFGISSAPEEFQRRQRDVLEVIKMSNQYCQVIFWSTDVETPKNRLTMINNRNLITLLKRCYEKNLKLITRKSNILIARTSTYGQKNHNWRAEARWINDRGHYQHAFTIK